MPEARATVPEQGIEPGLNSSGSDLAKNVFVEQVQPGGDDPVEIDLPSAGGRAYGVVVNSTVRVDVTPDVGIPDGQIGDIQVKGIAPVLAAVTLEPGDEIATDAAGNAVIAASGNRVLGKCRTNTASGDIAEITLAEFGVGGQLN